MTGMHPTLLVGPADWDARRFPRVVFGQRLDALWQAAPGAGGAIVYGNARDHAALAYLTHLTPKLEAAVALIPKHGEPRLLLGGGINMLPAAKPLTWIERLEPLHGLGPALAAWTAALASPPLLIGGDAMPYGMRRQVAGTLGSDISSGDAVLRAAMRRKSPHELAAIRDASAILDVAVQALAQAQGSGAGVTDAVLAAEHAAHRQGAQDVRSLFSLDGGATLRPFEVPVEQRIDPLQVYLAVRCAGYWAEGFVHLGTTPDPVRKALDRAIAAVAAGRTRREIAAILAPDGHAPHPAAQPAVVSLGLAIEDGQPDDDTPLVEGEVVSLRTGFAGGAVVSAVIAISGTGAERLWSAP